MYESIYYAMYCISNTKCNYIARSTYLDLCFNQFCHQNIEPFLWTNIYYLNYLYYFQRVCNRKNYTRYYLKIHFICVFISQVSRHTFFLIYQQMRVMKMGAFNNGRKYKRLMSVSVCRDASTSWGSARGKRYISQKENCHRRDVSHHFLEINALRDGWSTLRKTDRRASPLASKRAAKASWQPGEHPIGRRTVIRVFRGRGGGRGRENTGTASYSVCIHCAFSVLLTGTNPGCQE